MSRELAIIDELRCEALGPPPTKVLELLDELEGLILRDTLWPLQARVAAEEVFGGAIHNPRSRTHGSLDRRIRHALKVWRHRYGLNGPQLVYAGDVLAAAIRRGASDAGTRDDMKYPFVLKRLDQAVNHEVVHAGMQKRSGFVRVGSVADMLAEGAPTT